MPGRWGGKGRRWKELQEDTEVVELLGLCDCHSETAILCTRPQAALLYHSAARLTRQVGRRHDAAEANQTSRLADGTGTIKMPSYVTMIAAKG